MPCRMSPKSSIHVQSNPMENHSTGMLMNVMEIPRAKMTLQGQKHQLFPVFKEGTRSHRSQSGAWQVMRKPHIVWTAAANKEGLGG